MTKTKCQTLSAHEPRGLDEFLTGYAEAALWSTTDESDDSGGEPLDWNFDRDDIAPETLTRMRSDCARFLKAASRLVAGAVRLEAKGKWTLPGEALCSVPEFAGHDFWMTRNDYGVGYWDGDWPEGIGEGLDRIAQEFCELDLYVGDDGLIHGG